MTAEIVELDALLEDFSDEKCSVVTTFTWGMFGRGIKRVRECARPAKFMVRTNCGGCGPRRRFICRRHLAMIRAIPPQCADCGQELTWVWPGSGDAL